MFDCMGHHPQIYPDWCMFVYISHYCYCYCCLYTPQYRCKFTYKHTGNSYFTILKVRLCQGASKHFSLDRVLAAIGVQTSKLPFLNIRPCRWVIRLVTPENNLINPCQQAQLQTNLTAITESNDPIGFFTLPGVHTLLLVTIQLGLRTDQALHTCDGNFDSTQDTSASRNDFKSSSLSTA